MQVTERMVVERQFKGLPDTETVGKGCHFKRIHRITGYLVGSDERWNDAKKAELKNRVSHATLQ